MTLARGRGDKGRQVTAVVQPHVQFDGALGLTILRPGKDLQTQVNETGIQGIEFVFESKAMPRRPRLAA